VGLKGKAKAAPVLKAWAVGAAQGEQDPMTAATATREMATSVCPEDYPLPYCAGRWPTEYPTSGGFPEGFVWGVGTAAYQVEGAYREDGRGASVWDVFTGADTVGMPGADCSYCCRSAPCEPAAGMQSAGSTGNVADDHYHMWRSDVALMRAMGLKHYRFSISWPRLIPTGRIEDGINEKGLMWYHNLIDGLLAAGITPYVTLFHWDLPQGLLDPAMNKSAWWSRDENGVPDGQITDAYVAFADLCFASFGDKVKWWFTFNEPWTDMWVGIQDGLFSDHGRDPWIGGHNVLVAHAAAVERYRTAYQPAQGGRIGIVINSEWAEPKTLEAASVEASQRALAFTLGWFADPIFSGTGDYPAEMRAELGDLLPKFTKEQRRRINGSADFFALNHYGSSWAASTDEVEMSWNPQRVNQSHDGLMRAQSPWLYAAPWGLRKLLNHVDGRYHHPEIYITESGWSMGADNDTEGAEDQQRVEYYAMYTSEMRKAIFEDGVDVRGYFAWSFVDNFEWRAGYEERFGITFRDFGFGVDSNGPSEVMLQPSEGIQVTRRKESSCWLERVWTTNGLVGPAKTDYGGCVDSSVFENRFVEMTHHCRREITVDAGGRTGQVTGFAPGSADGVCHRLGGDVEWPFPGTVALMGGTIVANYSAAGGFSRLAGYWRAQPPGILWGDGSEWLVEGSKALRESESRDAVFVRKL